MNRQPVVLDLFCGAGGAARGYADAGWLVTGVDINPQPRYPFRFIQVDALDFIENARAVRRFDLVHASPPCQHYSAMSSCRPGLAAKYPDLVPEVRDRFIELGVDYVIENVVGAPLEDPITLCGRTFGLELYRHRLFESNLHITAPDHIDHDMPTSDAGHWRPGTIISVNGHCAPIALARKAMGIEWMRREELVEAVPPLYTKHIGRQILRHMKAKAA